MKKRALAALFLFAFSTACYAAPPTYYYNKTLSPNDQQGRLTKDSAYCESVARGAAPIPIIQFPNTGGFTSGLAQGINQGTALREAQDAQNRIYASCMANLGWEQVSKDYVPPSPPPKNTQDAEPVRTPFTARNWSELKNTKAPLVRGGFFITPGKGYIELLLYPESISIKGNIVSASTFTFWVSGEQNGEVWRIQDEYDCANGRSRMDSIDVYSLDEWNRGKASLLRHIPAPSQQWTHPLDGSVGSFKQGLFCILTKAGEEEHFLREVAKRHDFYMVPFYKEQSEKSGPLK